MLHQLLVIFDLIDQLSLFLSSQPQFAPDDDLNRPDDHPDDHTDDHPDDHTDDHTDDHDDLGNDDDCSMHKMMMMMATLLKFISFL